MVDLVILLKITAIESLEDDYGRILAKDIIDYLERDFGKGQVIIINFSIINVINVYNHILNLNSKFC